jgi:hypothetical protein
MHGITVSPSLLVESDISIGRAGARLGRATLLSMKVSLLRGVHRLVVSRTGVYACEPTTGDP